MCGKKIRENQPIDLQSLSPEVLAELSQTSGQSADIEHVCISCVNEARLQLIRNSLLAESSELTQLQELVLKSMADNTVATNQPGEEVPESFGDRMADQVAAFGGSWKFILIFTAILFTWIVINSVLAKSAFDPYPFILMNLILSTIAALQAPVIMMSQNRQEMKDRNRAECDYVVNLKSELELRLLHQKMDHLLYHHMQSLLELQDIQLDYLKRITDEKS